MPGSTSIFHESLGFFTVCAPKDRIGIAADVRQPAPALLDQTFFVVVFQRVASDLKNLAKLGYERLIRFFTFSRGWALLAILGVSGQRSSVRSAFPPRPQRLT
jgi:hypothetical protein